MTTVDAFPETRVDPTVDLDQRFTLRETDDLAQHVDACVSQSGVTRARWIREALRDACLRQMARGAGLLP